MGTIWMAIHGKRRDTDRENNGSGKIGNMEKWESEFIQTSFFLLLQIQPLEGFAGNFPPHLSRNSVSSTREGSRQPSKGFLSCENRKRFIIRVLCCTLHALRFAFYVSPYLLALLTLIPLAIGNQIDIDSSLPNNTETGYRIRQITFTGNKHFDWKQLSQAIGVQAGRPYRKAEMIAGLNQVLAKYRESGFVFASIAPKVTSISADQVYIRLRIEEGKRIRIGQITIEGNHLFSTRDIRRDLGLREGTHFSQITFDQGIEKVLALYSEHGYPRVEIQTTDFTLSAERGSIDFRIQIREGNQTRIVEVKLSGLQKTKAEIVLRELPIQAGDVFNQQKIDQSFHRLVNLDYFYEVNPSLLEEGNRPDEIVFNAKVTEAQTGRFSGVIGYAPSTSEFDEAPQLTGAIEATETNLLGTGRQTSLLWKSGLLKTLTIGYTEPWAFGKPIRIGLEYSQVQQRNQFTDVESTEQAGRVSISTRFRRLLEGSLAVSYKQIDLPAIDASPSTTFLTDRSQIMDLTKRDAQDGVKYGITFSLTRDSRDYFLNPTRGHRDHVAFEFSRGDFKIRKLWLDLQQYFPTWQQQVIAIGLHGAAAWGNNIPPTELFYLGGANTLRGYDEDWFFGPRRLHANIEYRLLVGRTSQIFAFVDVGAVTKVDQPTVFDPFRVGYGFGMRLESKGGTFRMDYGLAEGRSALEGKIHVNLGTSF